MDYIALGRRIHQERKKLNLTQEKLAEEVNISTAYVGQIERGERSLTLDKLIDISNRLGVTVDYLLMDSYNESDDKLSEIWLQLMNGRTEEEKNLAINFIKLLSGYFDR